KMPDGSLHRSDRPFSAKVDAEAWLAAEKRLIDRGDWTPPAVRREEAERSAKQAALNTVGAFAERYLADRTLRPNTTKNYRLLLNSRILPHLRDVPLSQMNLARIKEWRADLDPNTAASNAAAYRLLRSILQAAEEEELIDRMPAKIRGATIAPVTQKAVPATLEQLATIIENMPERLRLLIVLAAFVGLREGELLELRRLDVDLETGRISVARKVDKDKVSGAPGACPNCGRSISAPKTARGTRIVHVPPPFWPLLAEHLETHAADGLTGLLFPGDRTDHMSVRYLMDRYKPAREAA